MTNYIANKTLTRLALSLVLLFLFSCDDEEQAFNPQLVTVQVSADFINTGGIVYLLASKSNGDVIEYIKLENDKTVQLNSATYRDNTFTLSVVEKYAPSNDQNGYVKGNSFHGIKRGANLFLKTQRPINSIDGSFTYSLQNINASSGESFIFSTNARATVYSYEYFENVQYSSAAKNPSRLFITKYDPINEPVGYLFPTDQFAINRTYTVDMGGSYTPFQSEYVDYPGSFNVGLKVYGRSTNDNFREQYQVFATDAYFGNPLKIYYPGNAFEAYASRTWMKANNFYYENFNRSQRSDFDFLTADIELNKTTHGINYSVDAANVILRFDFNMEIEGLEGYDWNAFVNAGIDKQLILPRLPIEITSDMNLYNYESWSSELQVELMQVDGINSIDEYLVSEAKGNSLVTSNTKYLYVYLGAGNAAEERLNLIEESIYSKGIFNCNNWFQSTSIYN